MGATMKVDTRRRPIEVTLLELVAAVARFTDDEQLLVEVVQRLAGQPNLRLIGMLRATGFTAPATAAAPRSPASSPRGRRAGT